ncbi:MAG: hypothetical protein M0R17_01955 [Candidatus Omnitrophica bacterium]|jgi:DnaJ-class molecular chaperone|nr:hypothetical protein [Candidatus Omnitrophota bacterium]
MKKFWLWLTFRKDCPECGGTGDIWSEESAKYDDCGDTCLRCFGNGYVQRDIIKKLYKWLNHFIAILIRWTEK